MSDATYDVLCEACGTDNERSRATCHSCDADMTGAPTKAEAAREEKDIRKLRRRLQERSAELAQAQVRINALESKVRAMEKYMPVRMRAEVVGKEEPRYKGHGSNTP